MTTSEYQFAIFRIKKLRTHQAISRVGRHNDRLGKLPANVDTKRLKLNRSFTPDKEKLLDRVKAKLEGHKYRHDAVKAVEIFCGFSPGSEKFIPIEQWAKASMDYVSKKFGAENLVSAVLHMDEETPHMHFVIIPFNKGRLSAKSIFGTRKQLREMQTEYHKAVEKFGLKRGTKGSSRPHLTMGEIYQGTMEGIEILNKAMASIPKKSPVGGWKAYTAKLMEHMTSALKPLTRAKTDASLAALEIESLRKLVNQADIANEDYKARLRQLDLREVASRLLGYEGEKEDYSTVFEDDARRIVITGDHFKDEKSDLRAERGAISLTRHILEVDFDTAVRTLAQHFPEEGDIVQAEAFREAEESIKARVEANTILPINVDAKIEHFAKPDNGKLKALTEHLEKIKGIPGDVIKSLINHSKMWANRWGSACFHRTTADDSRMGVTIIGTTTDFYQTLGPKDAFFTVGDLSKPTTVAIAQNPIDAMRIHAASGQPVIAVESIDLAARAFEFLRHHGVTTVILPDDDAGFGKRKKAPWKSEVELASFKFVENKKSPSKKKTKPDMKLPKL